jgi:hypothetical protein
MRIFEPSFDRFLPEEVRRGSTLAAYYEFQRETVRLGLEHVGVRLAATFLGEAGAGRIAPGGPPVVVVAEKDGGGLLIVGDERMPDNAKAAEKK